MTRSTLINYALRSFGAGSSGAAASISNSLRATADSLLLMLLSLVDRVECPRQQSLSEEIDACRRDIVQSDDPATIEQRTRECLSACERVFAFFDARRIDQRNESAKLISVVRHTISAVSEDIDVLHQGVNESLQRFDAISEIREAAEMQRQLSAEVTRLDAITSSYRQASQTTIASLSARIDTLEQELQATQRAATLDALTGTVNRGAFEAACRERLQTGRAQFTLLLIDVDDLKKVNDTHGHAGGDRALKLVATALMAGVRSNEDVVGRFGGDEFAVLAMGINIRQGEARFKVFASNLAQAIAEAGADAVPALTMSCGVAEYSTGDTVMSLAQRADEALYEAKRRGKNRVATRPKPHLRDL